MREILTNFFFALRVVATLLALLSIVLELWAFAEQAREIFSQKSGRSVSISYYTAWIVLYIAMANYGLSRSGQAGWPVTLHAAVCAAALLPIAIGLFIHKPFAIWERWFSGYLGLLVTTIFLVPNKYSGLMLFAAQASHGVCNLLQSSELHNERHTGALHFGTVEKLKVSACVWAVYHLLHGNWSGLFGSLCAAGWEVILLRFMRHTKDGGKSSHGKITCLIFQGFAWLAESPKLAAEWLAKRRRNSSLMPE